MKGEKRVQALQLLALLLPDPNYNLLKDLLLFLHKGRSMGIKRYAALLREFSICLIFHRVGFKDNLILITKPIQSVFDTMITKNEAN